MFEMELEREVRRFRSESPLDEALTPPASWYCQPEFLRLEKKRVFARHWQYLGHTQSLLRAGDYFSGRFLGEPFVVVKGKDQQIRGFFNVCRHHGTRVASGESGNCEALVCPYHGWTYELDGQLRLAPRAEGLRNQDNMALKSFPLQQWGSLIFGHFGEGDPPPRPRELFTELDKRLIQMLWQDLHFVRRRSYEIPCNWKVFVDNYLDGGYHVPHMHAALAGQLDLKAYRSELFEGYSIQSCEARGLQSKRGGDFGQRVEGGALYAWLYPNLMINRYGPFMDINWVIPLDQEKCLTVFDYFLLPGTGGGSAAEQNEFLEKSLAASHQVQLEDMAICQAVQEGLQSNAYDQGCYVPSFEAPLFAFHCQLQRDLLKV